MFPQSFITIIIFISLIFPKICSPYQNRYPSNHFYRFHFILLNFYLIVIIVCLIVFIALLFSFYHISFQIVFYFSIAILNFQLFYFFLFSWDLLFFYDHTNDSANFARILSNRIFILHRRHNKMKLGTYFDKSQCMIF